MGKEKAQTKHLRKNGAKKAPKQTNLTGLKKPGDPPASPPLSRSRSRCPLLVLGCRQILKKKRKLNTTEQQQKNHAQKCMVTPHTEPKHTRAKAKPKTKPNACAEHLRGRGTKRGNKKRHRQKSPQTQNLSTQTQEQSQAKQHLGPAPKT